MDADRPATAFDERLYGETVIKDGNYHYLAIRYNATNFSFGIGAFNPFKNVSRTIMENKNAGAFPKKVLAMHPEFSLPRSLGILISEKLILSVLNR